MKRALIGAAIYLTLARGHDIITTPITWNHEISRIVYSRCAGCHQPGGRAFSLLTYSEARPWAVAIREETEERRMPPWGAVKGFGDFRNDQALTPEQIELIANWVNGGAPEGEAKDLPQSKPALSTPAASPHGGIPVTADMRLRSSMTLAEIWPEAIPEGASFRVTAEFPDGSIEPLLWVYEYQRAFRHPFLLRQPLRLPRGATIRGVPQASSLLFLEASSSGPPAHQTGPY